MQNIGLHEYVIAKTFHRKVFCSWSKSTKKTSYVTCSFPKPPLGIKMFVHDNEMCQETVS